MSSASPPEEIFSRCASLFSASLRRAAADLCSRVLSAMMSSIGNVFHGEQNKTGLSTMLFHHSGVKNHSPAPDIWKVMLHLKVIERRLLRDNLFEEFPKPRDVPLAVTKAKNLSPFGLLAGDLKIPVKNLIGRDDLEVTVENEQRLPYCVGDGFGKNSGIVCNLFHIFKSGNIDKRNNDTVDHVLQGSIGERANGKPGPLLVLHLCFTVLQRFQHIPDTGRKVIVCKL